MAFTVDGQRSWLARTVVTASGGGRKAACCAIPAWTWRIFTTAMAAMKTAIPMRVRIIRFFM